MHHTSDREQANVVSYSIKSANSNSADSAGHQEPEQQAESARRATAIAARGKIAASLAEGAQEPTPDPSGTDAYDERVMQSQGDPAY